MMVECLKIIIMLRIIREYFGSAVGVLIIVIGLIYYFNDTRQFSNDYDCNFFPYLYNNWEKSELDLLKKQQKLIAEAKIPPKSFFPEEVEDAHKDLLKHRYLSQAQIREAERVIERDKQWKEGVVELNLWKQKKVNACLEYITENKGSKFVVSNETKKATYNKFTNTLNSGGISLVGVTVENCYEKTPPKELVSCIVLDNYAYQVDTSFRKGMGIEGSDFFFSKENFYTRAKSNLNKLTKYDEQEFLLKYLNQKTYEIFDEYAFKDEETRKNKNQLNKDRKPWFAPKDTISPLE